MRDPSTSQTSDWSVYSVVSGVSDKNNHTKHEPDVFWCFSSTLAVGRHHLGKLGSSRKQRIRLGKSAPVPATQSFCFILQTQILIWTTRSYLLTLIMRSGKPEPAICDAEIAEMYREMQTISDDTCDLEAKVIP